jgi:hypothetical protein
MTLSHCLWWIILSHSATVRGYMFGVTDNQFKVFVPVVGLNLIAVVDHSTWWYGAMFLFPHPAVFQNSRTV